MAITAPLGFLDRAVGVPSHICLFYYDDIELRESLSFLALGLADPTQATVLFGPRARLEVILGYLAEDQGRDIVADIREGRITLVDGAPTDSETLANIGRTMDALMERAPSLIRFLGFIGWGEAGWPSQEDLLRFEATVNEAVASYPTIAICTYNANRLPGPLLIFGGIETHPLTIIGDSVCENPHYVSPRDYLARPGAPWTDERRERLSEVVISTRRTIADA